VRSRSSLGPWGGAPASETGSPEAVRLRRPGDIKKAGFPDVPVGADAGKRDSSAD